MHTVVDKANISVGYLDLLGRIHELKEIADIDISQLQTLILLHV
jgi:hypothetical protein